MYSCLIPDEYLHLRLSRAVRVYSLWLRVNTPECLDLHMQNSSQSSPRSCFSCSEEINGCLACGHTSAGSVSAMNDKLISSAAAVFLPPRVCVCVHVLYLCVFQCAVTACCVSECLWASCFSAYVGVALTLTFMLRSRPTACRYSAPCPPPTWQPS